ncbi:L-histidine N(alpha)-methyltransferase [Alteriqipengyuania flavescens]|uniref:L-histidine N(alpha)-methyltransferase n=1 Tax=Alteriqipengyuania flavescens TaxID=3053610 RepID=UPI0025B4E510|nr:L-histidine N(alpha)-methyltransferase [Alteriqipengyuania flavescens]WJY18867.1 L-histidine N(alpha)-methyltransferase [Alteriqipengyuania flavescens]WJY24807.1 L-histidine N(alpha)-methyltransferase [Alteriqipengyuania flavescens]
MTKNNSMSLVDLDEGGVHHAFRSDVLEGLSQRQKAVPARWLYDDAGSELFEDITKVPEYYPTRAERSILEERGAEFRELIGPDRAVVEFGSGSSLKTPLLLSAIDPAAYVPLDIAGDFLRASAAELQAKFPDLAVYPIEADFMRRVELPTAVADMAKLGFFPGSTIGNMVARTAVDLLRSMRETLGDGSQLLIGMDLIKDPAVLEAAYDDAAGVTAEFNLNLARRINRELDGTIPVEALHHEARWEDIFARVEMHLVADRDIEFEVCDQTFRMAKGESIHTENSHKFDERSSTMLLLAGGWTPVKRWLDAEERFSLILADASEPRNAP